jgi:CsoR family transcriptional regulator, copper-sensing transcriptional repressor
MGYVQDGAAGRSGEAVEQRGSFGYRKDQLHRRLGRIEGQVRGITRMVDDEKYCVDILTQIAAVQAALDRVALAVLEDHIHGCVSDVVQSEEGKERLEELVGVVERFVALRK